MPSSPFYTTKEIGHGTGLGLSQVYVLRQAIRRPREALQRWSKLGTTVKLYLPRLLSEEAGVAPPETAAPLPRSGGGAQTILVVEDDEDVRANTTGIVRELGYTVLEAPLAATALHLLERHPEIKLLFTDIGLPGGPMNGRQLADAARKVRPDLKVLFTTGYAAMPSCMTVGSIPAVVLIPKPFTYAAVAAKLANMLDEPTGPPRILLVEDEVLVRNGRHRPARGSRLSCRDRRIGDGSDEQIKLDGRRHRPGDRRYRLARHQGRRAGGRAARPPSDFSHHRGERLRRPRSAPTLSPATRASTFIRKPYTQDDLRRAVPPLHDN